MASEKGCHQEAENGGVNTAVASKGRRRARIEREGSDLILCVDSFHGSDDAYRKAEQQNAQRRCIDHVCSSLAVPKDGRRPRHVRYQSGGSSRIRKMPPSCWASRRDRASIQRMRSSKIRLAFRFRMTPPHFLSLPLAVPILPLIDALPRGHVWSSEMVSL